MLHGPSYVLHTQCIRENAYVCTHYVLHNICVLIYLVHIFNVRVFLTIFRILNRKKVTFTTSGSERRRKKLKKERKKNFYKIVKVAHLVSTIGIRNQRFATLPNYFSVLLFGLLKSIIDRPNVIEFFILAVDQYCV